jgi:hypothetical protein
MKTLLTLFLLAALTGCASTRTAYNKGYDRGRSDAVKQQYWIVQNLQKDGSSVRQPRVSYVPVTTTYTGKDGAVTVPTTEYIRIEE